MGPGVGLGVVGHNLLRTHDQWLVTAAPALHEQVATASIASSNPRRARQYFLFDTRALHTDRDWLGPADTQERTVLNRSALRARLRFGHTVLNHRLHLQPHVTLIHHDLTSVDRPTTTSGSLPGIDGFLPEGGAYTGLRVGGAIEWDTRDHRILTRRGLLIQSRWDRYVAIDGSALQFDQVDFDVSGAVPLGGLHRLVARTSVTVTNPHNGTSVPVFMLPVLDGTVVPGWARGRFVAPDRAFGSVLYRFPVKQYGNLAIIEAHIGMHAASSYRDLGTQFSPSVSFREDISLETSDRPLRPSASVGVRLVSPLRAHASLELAAGMSPEGLTAVEFTFVRSLQRVRPPHHVSHNLR